MVKKRKSISKLTKKQVEDVQDLNEKIENLELGSMDQTEIEKTIKSFSTEGMELRRIRKDIRYQLYRLRTEKEGKAKASSDDDFKEKFESQPFFGGWKFFGTTWDVAFDDPYRIVHKELSEQEEWEEVMRAKFPSIDTKGRVSYPDINVRKKIEEYHKKNK